VEIAELKENGMNREDIIRMAREAATEDGSVKREDGKNVVIYAAKTNRFLERFAALVEAHITSRPCCQDYYRCQRVCMPRAAAISRGMERDACAITAEAVVPRHAECGNKIAAAIRARGQE
jgi:hypothetical protein